MADVKKFDLVVIGAGPGGYVAAIRAAQLGKKVALVEKAKLGGTCLNVGCIPTKTLIAGAEVLHKIKSADLFGIKLGPWMLDYKVMKQRKDGVVSGIRKGLDGLIRSNGIEIFEGTASFVSPKEIKVMGSTDQFLYAENTVVATGSDPLDIAAFPCDHDKIVNSTSILDWENLPESLAIIGGGYIGCEFASLFAELGVKVTIFEMMPKLIALQGTLLSETLTASFKSQGIEIMTDVAVSTIKTHTEGVVVSLKDGRDFSFAKALVSVGRKFVSKELNLEKAGVFASEKGHIPVNHKTMETNVSGIYAIGDITGIAMLAHAASHQGIIAAEHLSGLPVDNHDHVVPAVIFTHPEIAMVGLTEEAAKEKGLKVKVGKFPFQALGKSVAASQTEGFAVVVAEEETGAILGAQVVGAEASVLIAQMALAVQNELTLDCLIATIHAHPTVSEAWHEAALMATGSPLHLPSLKKKKG